MEVLWSHQPFLAVHTHSGIFVDHFNPFGLSSAAGTLGVATDATVDIAKLVLDIPFFIKWVNDLLPTHIPSSQSSPGVYTFSYQLSDIIQVIKTLDFTWNIMDKCVSLPEMKCLKHLAKLTSVLSSFLMTSQCSLSPLVNLQGSLSHLCFVYHEGWSCMPSLHRFIASFHDNAFICRFPPPSLLSDLHWWHQTLQDPSYFHPISFHPLVDPDIFVNASTSWGIGLTVASLWKAWSFLSGWQSHGHNIGWAESIALELAVNEIAACGFHDVHVLVHSDNKGSIGQYIHGQSCNPFINESIVCTSLITRNANFNIALDYVKSSRNPADAASCGMLPGNSLCLPVVFWLLDAITPFLTNV
jgi:hypothetical protein